MALISSPLVFWAGSNTSYPGRMKKILRYHRDSGEIEKQPVDTFKRSSPHKENCFFFFQFGMAEHSSTLQDKMKGIYPYTHISLGFKM